MEYLTALQLSEIVQSVSMLVNVLDSDLDLDLPQIALDCAAI